MKSSDLTPQQARKLRRQLNPVLAYLVALRKRMGERDIDPADRLYVLNERAVDAVGRLVVEVEFIASHPTLPGFDKAQ